VNSHESAKIVEVLLDLPIAPYFDYRWEERLGEPPLKGDWVVVPWGRGRRVGLVNKVKMHTEWPADRVKAVLARVDNAPVLPASWWTLTEFASTYYHRHLGEVALPALPKMLRTPPSDKPRARRLSRTIEPGSRPSANFGDLTPTVEQQHALGQLSAATGFVCYLLHGVTGSGKTEVYLRWIAQRLALRDQAQALMLVPEIALTPQLAARVQSVFGEDSVVILHSLLADGERAEAWKRAVRGQVRLVVGTRLAVLTPLPHLEAIVVDEEHDPSFKQQDAVRYSARDLAVARASQENIPIVLGSATPSLESWVAAQRGRYTLLRLTQRPTHSALPAIHLVDIAKRPTKDGLSEEALQALRACHERGEQSLVFVNRRGYSPVLHCTQCLWTSRCDACSAHRVLHRVGQAAKTKAAQRYRLVCHHCSASSAVPRACPQCGNQDLTPLGAGTQRLESVLEAQLPGARIARLDRDVARKKGAAQAVLQAAHAGDVDVLVGTQMLAKGHDFQRLALVVVLDADGGLYSSDFRAPERLLATLMQVSGRAGRGAGVAGHAKVLIQTRFVEHPLFDALQRHDFPRFAAQQLAEREAIGLPPFRYQALVRVEARRMEQALQWLDSTLALAEQFEPTRHGVTLFDPIPMGLARVANVERAQLLIESASRLALHRFLTPWHEQLRSHKLADGVLRWHLELDPIEL
jgi:primosomal protein N' (replication factor Y)